MCALQKFFRSAIIDFKKNPSSWKWYFCFTLPVFIAFTWYCARTLIDINLSFADRGDGIGTISNYGILIDELKTRPWIELFRDRFVPQSLLMGALNAWPTNPYWRFLLVAFGQFVDPRHLFDWLAYASVVLSGIGFVFLCRELKVNALVAAALTYFYLNSDHFPMRMAGHLGLISLFWPMLATVCALRAGKNPTLKRIASTAVFTVLGLAHTEYIGYFAAWFALVVLIVSFIQSKPYQNSDFQLSRLVLAIATSLAIFVALFWLLFPSMISDHFSPPPFGFTPSDPYRQAALDFSFWSLHPWTQILMTSHPWLKALSLPDISRKGTVEQTFRLGLMLPLISLFCGVTLVKAMPKGERWLRVRRSLIFPILVAGLVLFAFGLRPEKYFFSLVPFTFKVAPMFRVGYRALNFFHLAAFLIFGVLLTQWFSYSVKNKLYRQMGTMALVFGVFFVADIKVGRGFSEFKRYQLPSTEAIKETFANKPQGWLMHLPFDSPANDTPESFYIFRFLRLGHGMPVLNAEYRAPSNTRFAHELTKLSNRTKDWNESLACELASHGIRYLVVDVAAPFYRAALEASRCFKKLPSEKGIIAYEARDSEKPENFNVAPALFASHFLYEHEFKPFIVKGLVPPRVFRPADRITRNFLALLDHPELPGFEKPKKLTWILAGGYDHSLGAPLNPELHFELRNQSTGAVIREGVAAHPNFPQWQVTLKFESQPKDIFELRLYSDISSDIEPLQNVSKLRLKDPVPTPSRWILDTQSVTENGS